uniref:hypothetical protein n=1 Tax=Shigella dysenteriae TaxID=622 RepID=UPI0036F31095
MNVNAGHERTSKARIIHQIQLIRGISKSIIDKLSLAGKSGEGLYFIDKELSTLDTQN